jgi:pimeloyl-ACP methyl ester carboxylesterase
VPRCGDADLREAIRGITVPALVVAVDFDASTPPAEPKRYTAASQGPRCCGFRQAI